MKQYNTINLIMARFELHYVCGAALAPQGSQKWIFHRYAFIDIRYAFFDIFSTTDMFFIRFWRYDVLFVFDIMYGFSNEINIISVQLHIL